MLLVAGIGGRALAQESQPTAEDLARQHFHTAQIQYNLGRFDEARAEYTKAYELMPLPEFLFNIGQCHKKMGDYKNAIFFYEGYLRENPQAENRALVEDLITETRVKLREKNDDGKTQREQQRREDEKSKTSQVKAKPISSAAKSTKSASVTSANDTHAGGAGNEPTPFYQTWWFWAAVGTATAVAVCVPAVILTWNVVPESRPILSFGLVGAD